MCFLLACHFHQLQGKLQWIEDEDIDGSVFDTLTKEDIEKMAKYTLWFGDIQQILNHQNSKLVRKPREPRGLDGKDLLAAYSVCWLIIVLCHMFMTDY